MKSILDPSFRYTSSVNTDISKTFARARKAQRDGVKIAQAAAMAANAEHAAHRERLASNFEAQRRESDASKAKVVPMQAGKR